MLQSRRAAESLFEKGHEHAALQQVVGSNARNCSMPQFKWVRWKMMTEAAEGQHISLLHHFLEPAKDREMRELEAERLFCQLTRPATFRIGYPTITCLRARHNAGKPRGMGMVRR